jgi:hypothetical protein
MPCVVCKGDTKKGFTYCSACMEKDMQQKRLEQENELKEREKFVARKNINTHTSVSLPMINHLDLTDLDDKYIPNKILDKKHNKLEDKNNSARIFAEGSDKKQLILNEMKTIKDKMMSIENLLKETNVVKEVIIHKQSEISSLLYILVSRDMDDLNHIHGIFTNIDKGMTAYKKIVLDADKYSKIVKLDKIILYKSQVDELDTSFDTALFDDCEMEIIVKKDFNNIMIQNK